MDKKKYHWIDESIKIDFAIPKGINNIIIPLYNKLSNTN